MSTHLLLIKHLDQYPLKPAKVRPKKLIEHDARTAEAIVRLIELALPSDLSGVYIALELRLDPEATCGTARIAHSDGKLVALREESGLNAMRQRWLAPGVEVALRCEEPQVLDGYTWRAVVVAGQAGWVAADYLEAAVPE